LFLSVLNYANGIGGQKGCQRAGPILTLSSLDLGLMARELRHSRCRSSSLCMNAVNVSGVFIAGTVMPSGSILLLKEEEWMTSLNSLWRYSMIGSGVLGGAASPTNPA
jgi:hypothetical protein